MQAIEITINDLISNVIPATAAQMNANAQAMAEQGRSQEEIEAEIGLRLSKIRAAQDLVKRLQAKLNA